MIGHQEEYFGIGHCIDSQQNDPNWMILELYI